MLNKLPKTMEITLIYIKPWYG